MMMPATEGPQSGSIHHGRVQRDGIAQVGAVLHHLHHKGLPRGHVEGVDRTLKKAKRDDVWYRDSPRQSQYSQAERLQHRENLGNDQHPVTIKTVHPYAGERAEQQDWNLQ
jgi:hypothetical protein